MIDWFLIEVELLLTMPFNIFSLITAYVFWPYYRAMWKYRKSGKMATEADMVVEFTAEWALK